MDLDKVRLPRKDSKAGVLSRQTSRAVSPDIASSQLDSKKNTVSSNRKRKANGAEVGVVSRVTPPNINDTCYHFVTTIATTH